MHEFASAREHFRPALDFFVASKDLRDAAILMGNLAQAHRGLNEPGPAEDLLKQAVSTAKELGDSKTELMFLLSLGELHLSAEQTDQALADFEACLDLARQTESTKSELDALSLIGPAQYKKGNLDKALEYLQQAVLLAQGLNDWERELNSFLNLTNVSVEKDGLQRAIDYVSHQIDLALKTGNAGSEAVARWGLGYLYFQQGDISRAKEQMQLTVEYRRSLGTPDAETLASFVAKLSAQS